MKKSFDEGKDIYCWCLLDETNLENISIPEEGIYYTAFFNGVEEINQNVKKYYKKESMTIHSPGSFVWYDMKNIGNHIGLDVVKEISLDHNMIKDNFVSRHYCELFIWRFLDRKNIQEQTFINNIRNQIRTIKNSTYTQLYCSKKVCCEYIKDFDKYIIQNKLI
jgi:hypothetical protein